MKKILFIPMLLSFSIISACSDKEETPNVPSKPQEEQQSNVPSKPQEEQQSNVPSKSQKEQQSNEPNKSQEEHLSNENQEPSKTNKGNIEASLTQADVLKNIKSQLKLIYL